MAPLNLRCITRSNIFRYFQMGTLDLTGYLYSGSVLTTMTFWPCWKREKLGYECNVWCIVMPLANDLIRFRNPLVTTMSDFMEASDEILQGLWDAHLAWSRLLDGSWIGAVTAAHFCSKWHDMMGVTTFGASQMMSAAIKQKTRKKTHVKWWLECPKTQSVWSKCFGPFLAKRAVSSKKTHQWNDFMISKNASSGAKILAQSFVRKSLKLQTTQHLKNRQKKIPKGNENSYSNYIHFQVGKC